MQVPAACPPGSPWALSQAAGPAVSTLALSPQDVFEGAHQAPGMATCQKRLPFLHNELSLGLWLGLQDPGINQGPDH